LEIVRVPVLSDNYAWLLHHAGHTVALDPGEAAPVAAAATARGWTIGQIWLTQWHPDHVGGAEALRAHGATVAGPAADADKIAGLDTRLAEGDRITIGGASATNRAAAQRRAARGGPAAHRAPARSAAQILSTGLVKAVK
jgi:hydroxyacylglutathione hydrolase